MSRFSSKCAGANRRRALYLAVLGVMSGNLYAAPEGGQVTAGAATISTEISTTGTTTTIEQTSQRAVLEFDSFNVGAQETVNFVQPNSNSVALNRVTGSDLSRIDGAINANGHVYLINPNGLLFGEGAQVNVGGLVATTLNISDPDFMSGRDQLQGGSEGLIENRGHITASDRVALVAPNVINSGDIKVPGGEITLRSSQRVLLQPAGSEIPILLDDPELTGQIINQGSINGGRVTMALDGRGERDVYDNAINNSGLVRAVTLGGSGGSVELLAGAGDVVNEGSINVDAAVAASAGGDVTLSGARYGQTGSITANGSGAGKGGDVAIRMEQAIVLTDTSTIKADGGSHGDGGNIVVYAEGSTQFASGGTISARGGSAAGDGGFVEVSGKQSIHVDGLVDVGADHGESGLWYIDPINVWIYNSAETAGGAFVLNAGSYRWNNAEGPIGQSWIDVTTIQNTLVNNGNVLIRTVSPAAELGNIHLDGDLDFNNSNGRTLTLQADNRIYFETGSRIFDGSPPNQNLNVVLTAGENIVVRDGVGIGLSNGTFNATAAGRFDVEGTSYIAAVGINIDAGTAISLDPGTHLDAFNAAVNLTAGTDVHLGPITTTGTTTVNAGGNLYIPTAGFVSAGPLSLTGNDILREDNGRTVAVTAGTLTLNTASSGGNTQVNTTSNTLAVANSGTNTFTVVDADGITVSSLNAGGTVNLSSTNANLVLSATPTVAGSLSLTTVGSGDVVLPNAGLNQSGSISITADNVRDSDNTLTIAASDANITLRGGATARTWNTSLSTLTTNITGSGALTVVDTNALTVNSLTTGGNASISSTNGNLVIGAAPSVAGTLSLAAITSGDVIIPDTGLTQAGTLNITADTIRDSDTTVTLNASSAGIALRGSVSNTLNVDFNTMVLDVAGNQTVTISDSDDLSLPFLGSVGDLTLSAAGNLTISDTGPDYIRSVTLNSGGTLTVAPGTLVVGNTLTVNAVNVTDGDSVIDITAPNVVLNLQPTSALTFNTAMTNLSLTSATAQTINVNDTNGFNVSTLSSPGSVNLSSTTGDIGFSTTSATVSGTTSVTTVGAGNLVTSDGGLTFIGGLTANVANLRDSDSNVSLGATNATITVRDGSAAQTWNTSFATLVSSIAGTGALTLVDSNGLTVNGLTTGGAASISSTGANLVLGVAPAVAGSLTLATVGSGNVVLPNTGLTQAGALTITADNLLDSNNAVTLAATDANITLRDGATVRTWNTSFDTLVANITGTGRLTVVDSNGLTVNGLSVGGVADISSTGANLVLGATPTVGGNLLLSTIGSGDVVVPNTGLTTPAYLTVNADNLRDTDQDVTLTATLADISLRDGAAARTWNMNVNNLAANIAGAGTLTVTNPKNLIISGFDVGGDANLAVANGNLDFNTSAVMKGNLSLTTVGNGEVHLSGDLDFNGLADGHTLTLTAAGALFLANGTQIYDSALGDQNLNVIFDSGAYLIIGDTSLIRLGTGTFSATTRGGAGVGGAFRLEGDAQIQASSVTINANTDIRLSPGTLIDVGTGTLTATAQDDIELGGLTSLASTSFDAGGEIYIPTAGLSVTGDLSLIANDILNEDLSRAVAISADNLILTSDLVGGDLTIASNLNTLAFTSNGSSTLNVVDANGLTVSGLTSTGAVSLSSTNADLVLGITPTVAGSLTLATVGSGDVILPNTGLTQTGALIISADNVRDSDNTLSLAATDATISLRDGAAARTWNTAFNTLVTSIAGAGQLTVVDANGLTVNGLTTGGGASISSTNANLTLGAAPTVAGNLTLATIGSGDVILPNTGLTQTGVLVISADNLRDSDNTLTLAATDANITLRDGAAARTWNTAFNTLVTSIAGAGQLTVVDANGLTVNGLATGGGASISSTNANLTLGAAPVVAGSLTLATIGTGDVILPNAGLTQIGALVISADSVRDSDNTLTLAATDAIITLRDGAAARTWNTAFNTLVTSIAGTGQLTVVDADGLTVNGLTTGGDASISSTNGNLTLGAAPVVAGNLTLATIGSGDVILPNTGLTQTGALVISADNLRDSDNTLTLAATDATITLRDGAVARTWNTAFNTLVTSITGAGQLTVVDANGLTVNDLATGGGASITSTNANLTLSAAPVVAGNLTLTTIGSGDVILPNTGLTLPGALTVTADNLRDSDNTLTLAATDANITLRDGAAARTWLTSFTTLTASIAGTGALTLLDSNGLTVNGLSTGGNVGLFTTNADLVLNANPTVAGSLTLAAVGIGDVVLPNAGLTHVGDLTISAANLRDTDNTLTLSATNATIGIRDGSAAQTWNTSFVSLNATIIGGGALTVVDTNGLTLSGLTTGGAADITSTNADLTLAAAPVVAGDLRLATTGTGNLNLPTSGLQHTGNLTLDAAHIVDGDAQVSLAATQLVINQRLGDTDTTFNTSAGSLNLNFAGASTVNVIETDALDLLGLTAGGNANVTTGGNLTVAGNMDVAGLLSLRTLNAGQLIANNGIVNSGDLLLDVAALSAGPSMPVSIQANAADITLRDQQQALILNTSLQQLSLNHSAASALRVVQTGDLRLNSVSTGGDFTLVADADLLLIPSAPSVGGNLNLTVADTLTIADQGLQTTSSLIVDAGTLRNASGTGATLWQADDLNLRIRTDAQGGRVSTQTNRLTLQYDGLAPLTVDVQNGAGLSGLVSSSDLTINGAGGLNLLTDTTAVDGVLSLLANGNVNLANTGLTVLDGVRIRSVDLVDADGGTVSLAGQIADIVLTGNQALSLNSQLAQLSLDYAAAADLNITNQGSLLLTSLNAAKAPNLSLAVNGTLTVPDTGLSALNRLTVNAVDLLDSDRTLDLTATEVAVQLGNSSGDNVWNLNADTLDVALRGQANLRAVASGDLTLQDLNGDGSAVDIGNGNFNLDLAAGQLVVNDNLSARDQTDDGVRAGIIDLQVAAGNIVIGGSDAGAEALVIQSINNVDGDAPSAAGGENAIRLQLTDTSATDRRIVLGNGVTDVSVLAVGGDIEMNTRPANTAASAARVVVADAGVTVGAYSNPTDPVTGEVILNGSLTNPSAWQQIQQDRKLTLVTDVSPSVVDVTGIKLDDIGDHMVVVGEEIRQGEDAGKQFEAAFGRCDELDKNSGQRCRLEDTLKAFLSHWLVGGEMPPKSEI